MNQATDRRVRRGFGLVIPENSPVLYRMDWLMLVLTSTSLRGITSVIVVQVLFCFFLILSLTVVRQAVCMRTLQSSPTYGIGIQHQFDLRRQRCLCTWELKQKQQTEKTL